MAAGEAPRDGVTRRELLQGLAALSTAVAGNAYADPQIALAMLDALTQAVGGATLARLATVAASTPAAQLGPAIAGAGLAAPAETVVAALFSGIVDTPRGPRVISYDQALVWQALAWTKPNAFCGGETNYWASAPTRTP